MNILPPLAVVDRAIYQSSHKNKKHISALKHPPFNISRPSLAKALELHRNSMVSFAHACKSGVSLPNLCSLHLRGPIGGADMTVFYRAIASGSLRSLKRLDLGFNQIGDAGMIEFSRQIPIGSLRSLTELFLNDNQIGDAGMIEFSRSIASGSMGKLAVLRLGQNKIGDQGMIALSTAISSGSMGELINLYIQGNPISNATKTTVQTAASNRTIHLVI